MATTKKLLFLHRQPPLADGSARELLEAVLIAAAFEQEVRLIFLDDGVFQLMPGVEALSASLAELAALDLDALWVESESLVMRGLAPDDLALPAKPISRQEIAALIADADLVYTA